MSSLCPCCSTPFDSLRGLAVHLRTLHWDVDLSNSVIKSLKLQRCHKCRDVYEKVGIHLAKGGDCVARKKDALKKRPAPPYPAFLRPYPVLVMLPSSFAGEARKSQHLLPLGHRFLRHCRLPILLVPSPLVLRPCSGGQLVFRSCFVVAVSSHLPPVLFLPQHLVMCLGAGTVWILNCLPQPRVAGSRRVVGRSLQLRV